MRALAVLLIVFAVGAPAQARDGLRAAAVKVDITPQDSQWLLGYQARQSNGVHDNIYHRVLALDTGETSFYLISTDACLYSPSFHDTVMRGFRAGPVSTRRVWWSVTHTHAAPELGPPDMQGAARPFGP
jgi:hypothetical protein